MEVSSESRSTKSGLKAKRQRERECRAGSRGKERGIQGWGSVRRGGLAQEGGSLAVGATPIEIKEK